MSAGKFLARNGFRVLAVHFSVSGVFAFKNLKCSRVDEFLLCCVAYSSNSHFEQKIAVNMDIPSFACNDPQLR